jgi:hypothetical protein
MMGGPHTIAALTRLKTRVRYPLVVRRIEAALAELASRLNIGARRSHATKEYVVPCVLERIPLILNHLLMVRRRDAL